MKIPIHTEKPRFYAATNLDEAFSSWDTIEEARASLGRFKSIAPKKYEQIIGIIETTPDGTDIRDHIFHAKSLKPIDRIPGGMVDGGNAYVVTVFDQGFHFHLVSEKLWTESQNTLKRFNDIVDSLFPAQEDDIADEPEVLEHVRRFSRLDQLLRYIEKHNIKILGAYEEGA